jgi:hypothetical protein
MNGLSPIGYGVFSVSISVNTVSTGTKFNIGRLTQTALDIARRIGLQIDYSRYVTLKSPKVWPVLNEQAEFPTDPFMITRALARSNQLGIPLECSGQHLFEHFNASFVGPIIVPVIHNPRSQYISTPDAISFTDYVSLLVLERTSFDPMTADPYVGLFSISNVVNPSGLSFSPTSHSFISMYPSQRWFETHVVPNATVTSCTPRVAFLMPGGSGKSSLSSEFGTDIDDIRDHSIEPELQSLRRKADWAAHNKLWHGLIRDYDWRGHSIIFMHGEPDALVLKTIFPKLELFSLKPTRQFHERLISTRNDSAQKLAKANWDLVTGYEYSTFDEARSFIRGVLSGIPSAELHSTLTTKNRFTHEDMLISRRHFSEFYTYTLNDILTFAGHQPIIDNFYGGWFFVSTRALTGLDPGIQSIHNSFAGLTKVLNNLNRVTYSLTKERLLLARYRAIIDFCGDEMPYTLLDHPRFHAVVSGLIISVSGHVMNFLYGIDNDLICYRRWTAMIRMNVEVWSHRRGKTAATARARDVYSAVPATELLLDEADSRDALWHGYTDYLLAAKACIQAEKMFGIPRPSHVQKFISFIEELKYAYPAFAMGRTYLASRLNAVSLIDEFSTDISELELKGLM